MGFLICLLFGHKPPVYAKTGWYSPGEQYAKVKEFTEDGLGTRHGEVWAQCPRCQTKYKLCLIHIPDREHPNVKA